MYIDSHAHLTSDAVFNHLDALLSRASASGIGAIVNICTDAITLQRGLQLSQKHPRIYHAAATTPHDVEKEGEALFPIMEAHARQGHLIAIGETGLDYFHQHSPKELQKHFLRRYLELALSCQLPVIIHCRDAFSDLFEILDRYYILENPGVLHCFTGTEAEAQELLNRGWYLSFSGIITFKKSDSLRSVVQMVPLNRLLIETDTPYLAPQSHRGKVNEPSFITETAAMIASLKGIPVEEVAKTTSMNARKLFGFTENIPLH